MSEIHGLSSTPTWNSWKSMRDRCQNPNANTYWEYGGRGIKVCPEWESFKQFLKDMGMRPTQQHSLDRINGKGNYEPSNCRWATKREQVKNRWNAKLFDFKGSKMILSEISDICGINRKTLQFRLRNGMTLEQATTTPLKYKQVFRRRNGVLIKLQTSQLILSSAESVKG